MRELAEYSFWIIALVAPLMLYVRAIQRHSRLEVERERERQRSL